MYLMDDEELRQRKKEQMYGNMYLITELYIANQLNGNIIKTCLEDLQQEINNQNVEIMCYMMNKLMINLCRLAKNEMKDDNYSNHIKPTGKKSSKIITIDYADNIC